MTRETRLRAALYTAVFSKGTTAVLTLTTIPAITLNSGAEGYGAYSTANALAGWVGMLFLNLSTPVSIKVATAKSGEAKMNAFLQAQWMALINILVLYSMLIFAIPLLYDPISYYSKLFPRDPFLLTLVTFFIYNTLNFLLTPAESLQIGLQETHLINVRITISNIATIFALCLAMKLKANIFMICVVFVLPNLASRLINTFLVFARHPELTSNSRWSFRGIDKPLLAESFATSASLSGGSYLSHQLPVLALTTASPDAAATFAAGFAIVAAIFGILSMFTTPLVPAVSDAMQSQDWKWVEKAMSRLKSISGALGLIGGGAFFFLGEWLLTRLFGINASDSIGFYLAFGCYFALIVWENAHLMLLLSLGSKIPALAIFFLRSVGSAIAIISTVHFGWDYLAPYILSSAAIISCILLTLLADLRVKFLKTR